MPRIAVGIRGEDGAVLLHDVLVDKVRWRAERDADNCARKLRRQGYRTVTFNAKTIESQLVARNERGEQFVLRLS